MKRTSSLLRNFFKLPFDPLDRDVWPCCSYIHTHTTSTHARTHAHNTHLSLSLSLRSLSLYLSLSLSLSVQYGTVYGHVPWYQYYFLIISTFCTTFRLQHCINALRSYSVYNVFPICMTILFLLLLMMPNLHGKGGTEALLKWHLGALYRQCCSEVAQMHLHSSCNSIL